MRDVQDTTRIFFGAWITIEDDSGEERRHRIVGADEFDQNEQYITVDSPLAKLILGKTIDDEIVFERPGAKQILTIINIEYVD